MTIENRKFIRHPVNVPLIVRTVTGSHASMHEGVNVSYGGIAFLVDEPLHTGQLVSVRVPSVQPPFEATARVAFCGNHGVKYCVGVEFMDASDALRSRMVEQACAIEAYRIQAMKKGRRLSAADAADEWSRKHGHEFPSLNA